MGDGPRKHRLLFELGRGGMGTVYLAVAEGPAGFSKLKVVKQLNPRLASEPQFLAMFLDEARLSALLNHPNIVQTNEVGFDGQDYFIEMEYLDGQPYDAIIRRASKAGGIPIPVHLWILTQVLAGLHYAHELRSRDGAPLGLVHRDVSPHNVFVTYEGTVKLLDFGIAKVLGEQQAQTTTGVIKGKATYMAPEHAMKRPVDRRADVFAAGIMLWEALFGRRFWEGLEDHEIFRRLEAGDFIAGVTASGDVPEPLCAICARALAPNPDDRYPTAAALQEALDGYLEAKGARVGPRSTAKPLVELFADRRAAIEREIQERLGRVAENPAVSVPQLGLSTGYQRTTTGETRSEPLRFSGEPTSAQSPTARATQHEDERREESRTRSGMERRGTPVETNPGRRSRRLWAAAGVLGVATMGGAVWLGSQAAAKRSAASTPVTSAAPFQCKRNADCLQRGAPERCRKSDGACVALETPDCRIVAEPGSVENDDTIWFGSMFPTHRGDADEFGKPYERGMLVAREDFVKMSHGLAPLDGIGSARPLGIIACDDTVNAAAVARHLVDDVGVSAVIGFGSSAEAIDLATTVFLPKRVLTVSAANGSPLIARIPNLPGEPRLVWRTTAELFAMSVPIAKLVPQIVEPYVRRKGSLPATEPLRVALLRYDGLTDVSVAEDIVRALSFNGKSAMDNGHDFDEVVLHSIDDPVANAAATKRLATFAPQIVLLAVGDECIREIVLPLEASWPARLGYRPIYVENSDIQGPALLGWLERHPAARSRFYGMYGPLSTPANLRFTTRYNEGLARPVPYTATPSSSFDAFYVLAYAAYGAGPGPITGPRLARAIEKLTPPGEPLEVGAAHIFDAFDLLREGRKIDLEGAATNLDFDPETGDVTSDALLHCIRRGNGPSLESAELPVTFQRNTRTWSGIFGCAD